MATSTPPASSDTRHQRLLQQLRARIPFNPLDDAHEYVGANVTRLQKSMASFGWDDHRFTTREQALALGWKLAPKAHSVELLIRDLATGGTEKVKVFNAADVKGMPSIAAMLKMSEEEITAMRAVLQNTQSELQEVSITPASLPLAVEPALAAQPQALQPGFHRLIAHGAAPYMHDGSNPMSYFAELEDVNGRAFKLWGVDIERSLDAADAKIGDAISLHRNGHRMVTVDVREQDGSIVKKDVERVNWETTLQKLQHAQVSTVTLEEEQQGSDVASTAAIEGQPEREEDNGRFAVLAPYWRNGLHNHEGVRLAEQINEAIRKNQLSEQQAAIAKLLAIYPKAKDLGIEVVPELRYLNDPHLRANAAQPSVLLDGALVRDKQGMYRPASGGRAMLHDQDDAIVLKDKERDAYRGAMELAIAKGWTAIELKGKPAMLSNAWMEAKLMGLDVVNYSPTEQDLAAYHARLAQESRNQNVRTNAIQQSPEMVEVRPFIDENGKQKVATVVYTVTANGVGDSKFDNPQDAAKAYAGLSATGSAAVIRTVTRAEGEVRDEIVAGIGRGKNPRAVAQSVKAVVDKEFDEALLAVQTEHEPQTVSTGTHVGPIVAIEGNRFAQKTGRDANKLVWHDISKLNGVTPTVGAMAEIKYKKGQGQMQTQNPEREHEGGMQR